MRWRGWGPEGTKFQMPKIQILPFKFPSRYIHYHLQVHVSYVKRHIRLGCDLRCFHTVCFQVFLHAFLSWFLIMVQALFCILSFYALVHFSTNSFSPLLLTVPLLKLPHVYACPHCFFFWECLAPKPLCYINYDSKDDSIWLHVCVKRLGCSGLLRVKRRLHHCSQSCVRGEWHCELLGMVFVILNFLKPLSHSAIVYGTSVSMRLMHRRDCGKKMKREECMKAHL